MILSNNFRISLIILFLTFLFYSSILDISFAGWWNTSFKKCNNFYLAETTGTPKPDVNYTSVVRINITNLTFSNKNEIHIVNGTCSGENQTIQDFDIFNFVNSSAGNGWAEVYLLVNRTPGLNKSFAVFHKNTGSLPPLIETDISTVGTWLNNSVISINLTTFGILNRASIGFNTTVDGKRFGFLNSGFYISDQMWSGGTALLSGGTIFNLIKKGKVIACGELRSGKDSIEICIYKGQRYYDSNFTAIGKVHSTLDNGAPTLEDKPSGLFLEDLPSQGFFVENESDIQKTTTLTTYVTKGYISFVNNQSFHWYFKFFNDTQSIVNNSNLITIALDEGDYYPCHSDFAGTCSANSLAEPFTMRTWIPFNSTGSLNIENLNSTGNKTYYDFIVNPLVFTYDPVTQKIPIIKAATNYFSFILLMFTLVVFGILNILKKK